MSQGTWNNSLRAAMLAGAVCLSALAGSVSVVAQTHYPKDEIFGGYAVLFPNGWEELDYKADTIPNAFDVSNTWYLCKFCNLGLVLDGSGHYHGPTTPPNLLNGSNDSTGVGFALLGLQYKWHEHRAMPFVRVLAGGANLSPDCCHGTQWSFAVGGGGGLDIALTRRLSWRLAQADYLYTSYPHTFPSNHPKEWNSVRLATGIVINLGDNDRRCNPQPKACSVTTTSPTELWAGEIVKLDATGTGFDPKHSLQYSWKSSGGQVVTPGTAATQVDTTGMVPGTYTVTATISDAKQKTSNTATCTAGFLIKTPRAAVGPTASCAASPTVVDAGRPAAVTLTATNPDGRALTYTWTTSAGHLESSGASATVTPRNEDAGSSLTVTGKVTDDRGLSATCDSTVSVRKLPPPCVNPEDWGNCQFVQNPKLPARVDNACKDVLDKLALQLQGTATGKLVIVGASVGDAKLAAQRAVNVKYYLTTDGPTKVDADRMETRMSSGDELAHFYFEPAGELCTGHSELGAAVNEAGLKAQARGKLQHSEAKPKAHPAQ